jgi:hypothetical protein
VEGRFREVLEDFEAGCLKRVYDYMKALPDINIYRNGEA